MKGLALETIVAAIIAIAGVIVFLSLFGFFKGASNWFYCNIFVKIQSLFVRQDVSIPEACREYIKEEVKRVEISESDNKIFSRILLGYIIACWKDAEMKGLNKDHACFELELKNEVEDVTEENVTKILIEEDRCKSIENSDYNCGAKDQILWKVENDVIKNQKIILIRYNAKENAVEVIG
jgi:hypothetical protein